MAGNAAWLPVRRPGRPERQRRARHRDPVGLLRRPGRAARSAGVTPLAGTVAARRVARRESFTINGSYRGVDNWGREPIADDGLAITIEGIVGVGHASSGVARRAAAIAAASRSQPAVASSIRCCPASVRL